MLLARHMSVAARGAAKGWARGVGTRARAASNPGARPSSVVSITARRRPSSALAIGSARGALSAASRSICAGAGYARHPTRAHSP